MIKSMTGFGRCEISEGERKFTVELKGVNHRYLDVNIRMPKKLNFFETSIRNLLKQYATRGKVDIFITYEDLSEGQVSLKYNQSLAQEYLSYFNTDTLILLFCMLAVVAGLKCTNIFEVVARKMINLFHTRRAVIYSLIFGTFFFDMIVANDMSLITFLPLTYIVLHSTRNDKYLGITFIMQTIAANMGGMITPHGNP